MMTSKFGMKTYSRQKVCQSSIQFDQLFNDKGNKPTAAKSKGTLHRWGMTSFTSVRNSHLNGRKEDTEVVDDPVKRRKIDVALDDPFSFDLEPDALHKPCKLSNNAPQASFKPSSVAAPVSTPKTNKFFKSGASRSLYKLKQTPESPSVPKPHSVLVTVHKEPFLEEKSSALVHDTFSQLLLSTGVSSVSGSGIDTTCLPFKDDTGLTADVLSTYSSSPNVCNYSASNALVNHTYGYDPGYYVPQHNAVEAALHHEIIFSSPATLPDVNLKVPTVCSSGPESELQMKQVDYGMGEALNLMGKPDGSGVFEEDLEVVQNKLDLNIKSNSDHILDVDELNMDNDNLNSDSKPCEPVEDVFEVVQLEVEHNYLVNKSVEPTAFENKDSGADIGLLPSCASKSDFTESEDSTDVAQQSGTVSSVFSDKECYASNSPLDLKLQLEDSQDEAPKESISETSDRPRSSSMPYRSLSLLRQRRIFNSPKKIDRRALYKHRPWQAEDEPASEEMSTSSQPSLTEEFDFCEEDSSKMEKPLLTRVTTWPTRDGDEAITSVKCSKKFKELYAVVRNVKQAHQCHESGETQEFNDDVEYLLDGLQDTNSVATRCLSILSLAGKCMAPSFRMHLRAHGTLTKVFSALQDAPKETNLALCTATVLFILSQDRLNMDLERSSLELMLQLLETESGLLGSSSLSSSTNGHSREFDKNKEKVRELCDQLQKKGYAKHIDIDNITAGVLAMETLLSLTSRRAGEWFKEELRELGGLDHLVNTVSECGTCLPGVFIRLTEFALDKLRKLDRCLRVLENVTVMNIQNQAYLITCQDSALIVYCTRALKLCECCLKEYPAPDNSDREGPSWILFSCLLSVLKVLLNLTNENSFGSAKVGEQEGLISSALSCILDVPSHLHVEQRFDLLVLALGLVINLVEYCETNRQRVFYAEVANQHKSSSYSRRVANNINVPKALVNLFMEHEEAARVEEVKTDNLLDGKGDGDSPSGEGNAKAEETTSAPSSQEDIEETLKKALQKAGKNMEDSMIAAYIALLLGCTIQDNRDHANKIRDHFPSKDFCSMIQILKKFLNFMNLTNIVGSTGMKSIQRVIDILEAT